MLTKNAKGAGISVLSFIILALELSLIRFVPAEIKAISYFTNLLLFSSFFGLGLGCILSRKRDLSFLFPVGLVCVALFVFFARGIVIFDTGGQVHYWLQAADQRYKPFLEIPLAAAALLVFALSAIPFIALGQVLARKMDELPRLSAYSWDIGGSLAGTVLFAALSFLGTPPWIMIIALALLWAFFFAGSGYARLSSIFAAAFFLIFTQAPHSWKWSPYYFVQFEASANSITVWVNSSFHQEAIQFDSADAAYKPTALAMLQKFSVPYEVYRKKHDGRAPERVLILGAGTGNDVNVALKNGAKEITAVEIDPVIFELGKKHNRLQPYQQPNVKLVNDDGRHFLWNTKERFDLVVFGTLDSQTLLTGQANLRLENYIYTAECFQDVHRILNDGGMLATYYSVFKPWFLGRIYATVQQAFAGSLRIVSFQDNYLFNTIIIAAKNLPTLVSDPKADEFFKDAIPSSDDWPYIYLQNPTISPLYLKVIGMILVLIFGVFALLRRVETGAGPHLDFFFLGLGFTLLESAAVVRLALVFGTTWIVSAVVFSGVLLMVFISNRFLLARSKWNIQISWVLLFAAILANYFFPTNLLFGVSPAVRVLASFLLIGVPVFFAGTCFSSIFAREKSTGFALGINLIGAMAGGLIEYLSMLVGMQAIWLVLLAVYLLAYLFGQKKRAPYGVPSHSGKMR